MQYYIKAQSQKFRSLREIFSSLKFALLKKSVVNKKPLSFTSTLQIGSAPKSIQNFSRVLNSCYKIHSNKTDLKTYPEELQKLLEKKEKN